MAASYSAAGLWPVLATLLAAVLVAAGCVLWFMFAAMRNENLAARQRLTDVYRQKLLADRSGIEAWWSNNTHPPTTAGWPATMLFNHYVRPGLADSAIIYDSPGNLAYPIAPPTTQPQREPSERWRQAERLEFESGNPAAAAELYAAAATQPEDAADELLALQAEARCLAKAGRRDAAIKVLDRVMWTRQQLLDATGRDSVPGTVQSPALKPGPLVDARGHLIRLDCMMFAVQLLADKPEEAAARERMLAGELNDYGFSALPASQRRFLMHALQEIAPVSFPTLPGEDLAAEYVALSPPPPEMANVLTPAGSGDLWHMASPDGKAMLIFRRDALLARLRFVGNLNAPFVGITTEVLAPGQPRGEPFLSVPISGSMPGWELAVRLIEDPIGEAADKVRMSYLTTGGVGLAVLIALALLVARSVTGQVRLARLKNDLIATVSHELKTPLASMRVLVDTLLAGRCESANQAQDYLELIARENERLSRLIDNFLTFSRMERNKKTFQFAAVQVGEAVAAAVASVRDRFDAPGCRLDVDVAAGLPTVPADRDALTTVVLNLLDNAWKYAGDQKRVRVRAFARDGHVCIEVSDNGIGMSRGAARRAFDRFYQADQTLSRQAGGCGLGLSIVKFIVEAHGGSVGVVSEPGRGSTFTVTLPASNVDPLPLGD